MRRAEYVAKIASGSRPKVPRSEASARFASALHGEVVERRGGYAGYGAANAGVRMAAQARSRPWTPGG